MNPEVKERAGMFAREPRWISRLRESKWRHKYSLLFTLAWMAVVGALWLLNYLVS
jgi:hypothetical protein